MVREGKIIVSVLLLLILLVVSSASVEARTFRKPVSNEVSDDLVIKQESANAGLLNEDCTVTKKLTRGKRTVSSCPQKEIGEPRNPIEPSPPSVTGFAVLSPVVQPSNQALLLVNMKDKSEIEGLVNFIRENGGTVSFVFVPDSLIVENFSPQLEQQVKSKYGLQILNIYRDKVNDITLTYDQPSLVEFWNSKFEPPKVVNPGVDASPLVNDIRIPPDHVSESMPPELLGTPSSTHTSEYMFGNVWYSIILLESNGAIDPNTETWASNEESNVDSGVLGALDWWRFRRPSNVNLTFWSQSIGSYKHYKISTGYEPINRPSTDDDLWINEAMNYFGISGSTAYQKVRNYDYNHIVNNGTDWAFTIFVADSSNDPDGKFADDEFAYAYIKGPYLVMTYNNDGWGYSAMHQVAAHEIGHIFGANDEYASAPTTCTEKTGFLQVENQNYDATPSCLMDVDSIMRSTTTAYSGNAVDYYARGQIGWRDLDGDGVTDSIDTTYNPATNSDNDQIINYWDFDDDNDGVLDVFDNCPLISGPSSNNGCPVDPPIVSVWHSPANPTTGQTVTINVNANDNVQVSTIRIYVDGILRNTCTVNSASGSCTWSTSYASAGSHTYYATATDNYGNVGRDPASGTKSFTVTAPNTSPTVLVTHNPANPTVGQTVTVTANANDNVQVRTIAVFVDGVQANNCTVNAASGSCQYSASYGSMGTHTYYAIVVDNVGASGRDPSSGTKSFTVSTVNTPPTVSVVHSPATPNVGQTVTFTADATDNSQVRSIAIFVDGIQANNCTINAASGSCSYQTSYGSTGSHTYYAQAVDNNGVLGRDPSSGTKSFTVSSGGGDTTPPATSVSHSPANPNVGQTVTLTSDATDNIQVGTIAIFVDGIESNNCTINSGSGSCQYSVSYGAAGTHTYYSQSVDNSGNLGRDPASGTKNFDVSNGSDTNPPIVDIVKDKFNVQVGEIVTFTANATDDAQVTTLWIWVDTAWVQSCTINAPSGNCSYQTSFSTIGDHNYTAAAYDSSNNLGWAPFLYVFTVSNQSDNTSPIISVSAPSSVDTGQLITITADATDNLEVSTIAIFVDGIEADNCTVNAGSGSCQYSTSYGNAGTHTYYAETVDTSGNYARDPLSGTKNFTVIQTGDTTKPSVFVSAPVTVNIGQTIKITTDATDDVAVSTIRIYADGTEQPGITCSGIGTATASCYKELSFGVAGAHNYNAFAVDSSFNSARDPVSDYKNFTVIVDSPPSDITSLGEITIGISWIYWQWTNPADADFDHVEVWLNNSFRANTSGTFYNATGLAPSTGYEIEVRPVDISNNIGNWTNDTARTLTAADTTAPTITVSAPASVNIGQTITVSATANDNVQVNSMAIVVDGTDVQNCTINSASGSCNYQTSYGTVGTHTYFARTSDSSGNFGRDPVSGTKSFDVVQPADTQPPAVSVTAPGSVNIGQQITITSTVSDNVQVTWAAIFADGALARNCTINSGSGSCAYTTSYPSAGTHTYYSTVADSSYNTARNPSSGTKSFTVTQPPDTTKPTVTASASPDPVGVGQTITITGNANDNVQVSTIEVFVDGASAKTCTINSQSGSCPFQTSYAAPGPHTYSSKAIDAAGNIAYNTVQTFNVIADSTLPTVTSRVNVNGLIATITADADDDKEVKEIRIYLNWVMVKSCAINAAKGSCDYTKTFAQPGVHTYHIEVFDSSNNGARDPVNGERSFTIGDITPPKISLTLSGDDPSERKQVTFTATATDNVAVSQIKIYMGTNAPRKTCTINARPGTCVYKTVWPLVRDYYAVAVDSSGNSAKSN